MTSRALIENLKFYIDPFVVPPVYLFDRNETKELPCIVIGYDGSETSILGGQGHYTTQTWVKISYNGYDDPTSLSAEATATTIVNALLSTSLLLSVMTLSAVSDPRPAKDFRLNAIIIRGISRDFEDHSTTVSINFDSFCGKRDIYE
jgi:hypothetical protein